MTNFAQEFPGWEIHEDAGVIHVYPASESHLHDKHVLCDCGPEIDNCDEKETLWIHWPLEFK